MMMWYKTKDASLYKNSNDKQMQRPEVIESEAHLFNRKHTHRIQSTTSMGIQIFHSWKSRDSCVQTLVFSPTQSLVLCVCTFVCNSTFLLIALEEFHSFFSLSPVCVCVRIFFCLDHECTHMLLVKCAVGWLLSAISACREKKTTKESFLHTFLRNVSTWARLNRVETNADKHFYPLLNRLWLVIIRSGWHSDEAGFNGLSLWFCDTFAQMRL